MIIASSQTVLFKNGKALHAISTYVKVWSIKKHEKLFTVRPNITCLVVRDTKIRANIFIARTV